MQWTEHTLFPLGDLDRSRGKMLNLQAKPLHVTKLWPWEKKTNKPHLKWTLCKIISLGPKSTLLLSLMSTRIRLHHAKSILFLLCSMFIQGFTIPFFFSWIIEKKILERKRFLTIKKLLSNTFLRDLKCINTKLSLKTFWCFLRT